MQPLVIYDQSIHLRVLVSHELDRTFYALNTVALFDWATFGAMRALAHDKFGLDLTEVHLPGQTVEQGLDVLEVMRQLPQFVGAYRYNLHNQIFIEARSENKTLHSFGVQHIANSIRQHGPGIMATSVSVTYQLLKEKVHLFAQFLFDELIKSRLFRDSRGLDDNTTVNPNAPLNPRDRIQYTYERAKAFQLYVKQLGQTKDKSNYLDKFRQLVTEIGGALGYVRMIRSGGLLYTANAIQFVPDLSAVSDSAHIFQAYTEESKLAPETVEAAKNVDGVLETLAANFSSGTGPHSPFNCPLPYLYLDYFKMLVNVFKAEYNSAIPENAHLGNFYLAVPALTLSFVDHICQCKERYAKKRAEEGVFTEDGFALGPLSPSSPPSLLSSPRPRHRVSPQADRPRARVQLPQLVEGRAPLLRGGDDGQEQGRGEH